MNSKTLLTTVFFAGLAWLPLRGQLLGDALLFSDQMPSVTARAAAVGNAMGALGADITCLHTNPAGVGIFRGSELTISPMVTINATDAEFAGETLRENRLAFKLANVAFVMHTPLEQGKWKGFNFAVAYNRLASYNRAMSFSGSTFGSRIQNFVASAEGQRPIDLNPFEAQLAYDTYLIDVQDTTSFSYVGALDENTQVRKSQFRSEKGGLHEFAVGVGLDYNHKLYLGFTLGIPVVRYNEFRSYEELEETGTIDFKRMVFDETREIRGTGFNAKIGAVYRLSKFARIGAHIHTPTAFKLTETYYTEMMGEVMYGGMLENNTFDSPEVGKFSFSLRTPWVFGLSLAAAKSKLGYLGIEAEYLNYGSTRFGVPLSDETATIDTRLYLSDLTASAKGLYGSAFRLRVGGERPVGKILRLRAGYQLQTSPYRTQIAGVSDLRHQLSGGIGFRGETVFFDIAYVHTLRQYEYLPYAPLTAANTQQVIANDRMGWIMVTLGVQVFEGN